MAGFVSDVRQQSRGRRLAISAGDSYCGRRALTILHPEGVVLVTPILVKAHRQLPQHVWIIDIGRQVHGDLPDSRRSRPEEPIEPNDNVVVVVHPMQANLRLLEAQ